MACKLAAHADRLDGDGLDALIDALDSEALTWDIAGAFSDIGLTISDVTVGRHRRQSCSCTGTVSGGSGDVSGFRAALKRRARSRVNPEIKHDAKVLFIDIETLPNVVVKFDLRSKAPTPLDMVVEYGYMASFAAKWLGESETMFWSVHHDGADEMIRASWGLIDEADVVVTYNGGGERTGGFDLPKLRWEWAQAGLGKPASFRSLDLYKVAKQFGSPSRKLNFFLKELGVGEKVAHAGIALWMGCMRGDGGSWDLMREYNIGDVVELEKLYQVWLPWLDGQVNMGLWSDGSCPACGSDVFVLLDRPAYTAVSAFNQYRCGDCGQLFRGTKVVDRAGMRV